MMKSFTQTGLLFSFLLLFANGLTAQTNFFEKIADRNLPKAKDVTKNIEKMSVVKLDEHALRNHLRRAPMEFQDSPAAAISLEIPLPDGTTETFAMWESPNLSPEISAQFPDIKTYAGNGLAHPAYVLRMNLTSLGLSAVLLNVKGGAVYFEHYSEEDKDVYFSYFTKDAVDPGEAHRARCGVEADAPGREGLHHHAGSYRNNSGGMLRTYRLAMAASGEFTQENGGTQASGLAAITNYVNTLNAVFRNELSVHFSLVSGTNLIYTDPNADPYSEDEFDMLDENQTNVDMEIGTANYDVSHVLGFNAFYGSGGGIASIEVVCWDGFKAQGASIIGEGYGQVFYDQLVLHEIGHQFGMHHSYNSVIPVCTTRSAGTSVEPGAGATIMSYGFTCGTDDYFTSTSTGPILSFHTVSYSEAEASIANTAPGYPGDCVVNTSTGNAPPVVNMPSAYTIPKSTPFSLTGSADSPGGGDSYTYCWEGTNIGTTTPDVNTLADTSKPPFFRSYAASASPTRTFPILSAILDGSNYAKGDKLPSVSIATTHNLTVRDNNAAGGGVSFGSVTVTVDGGSGPFLETTNLAGSYPGLSSQTITWSVNNTNVAPVSCSNVNILLSSDGGMTFPTVLSSNTANDGTQTVTFPNSPTTAARIKIQAVGNVFFDISNSNFVLLAPLPVELVRFDAALTAQKDALLTWQTASEQNNRGFEVQRSAAAPTPSGELTWHTLGFVAGHGTTAEPHPYSFLDKNPFPGTNYYRLRQLDLDGGEQFSNLEIVELEHSKDLSDLKVYPNPVNKGTLTVEFPEGLNEPATLRLISPIGQLLQQATTLAPAYTFDLKGLPAGVYTLQVLSGGDGVFEKIIVKG